MICCGSTRQSVRGWKKHRDLAILRMLSPLVVVSFCVWKNKKNRDLVDDVLFVLQ